MASQHQRKNLSAICRDCAQISLASVAIPFLLDDFRPSVALFGLAFTFVFWFLSQHLLRSLP